MTASDRKALCRLAGADVSRRATTDDLQGLLLQVVFALLMIFMIAYFIFVAATKKEREEQVLDLNRQKLVLALEKTAEDRRVKYGLNALMTQGTDGSRTFDADAHVRGGRLALAPAAKVAFSSGSAAAAKDYADTAALAAAWRAETLASAGLGEEDLSADEMRWLDGEIAERMETMRLDARGVQRALAARLQRGIISRPDSLGDAPDAGALADRIKSRSLEMIIKELGAEVLP